MIISALGASDNGGPHDDGRTVDGIRPFVNGNVTMLEPTYWDRLHSYIALARNAGITVLLYPIDSWVIGHSFIPKNVEQCEQYGKALALRFSDLPNIVWMSGGDYIPNTDDLASGSDADHCVNQLVSCKPATQRTTPTGHLVSTGISLTPIHRPLLNCDVLTTRPRRGPRS